MVSATSSAQRHQPARPSWRLLTPFPVVVAAGIASLALPPHHPMPTGPFLALLGVGALTIAAFIVSLRRHTHTWVDPTAAYLLFPCVALMREVAGSDSGLSVLVLVPLLWLALIGTRGELWVGAALGAATFIVPLLINGAAHPTSDDWRRALIWSAISLSIAPLVQSLMTNLTHETRQAHELNAQLDEANRQLRLANERSRRFFEDTPHGVAVIGRDFRVQRANSALREIFGGNPEGLEALSLAPQGDDTLREHLAQLRSALDSVAVSEARLRRADGQYIDVELSSRMVRHDDPAEDFALVNLVDISERRRFQQRLAYLADHDELTGLHNRRRFRADLDARFSPAEGKDLTGALLLIDLDQFKQVNDTLGHAAGDQLLIEIGNRLSRVVRPGDTVARLGGDEFAIVLAGGGLDEAITVADRVVAAIRDHAGTLDGIRRRVSASVGVVTARGAAEHADDALALADMMLYEAKDLGRNQVAVLPEGDTRMPRMGVRLAWQNRIEAALDNDALVLHLQPIRDLRTGRIGSAEALLRMVDSDQLIHPSRFLPVAERAGLAPRIDQWVIQRAVALLAELRRHDPTFILEVNLSGHSIGDPDLEATIPAALQRHAVAPSALVLEITETAAVSDMHLARTFAERMSALGCKFALDDFGAGFGSFYYLKHLLFDFVKIDGEFVAGSDRSEVDRTIVRSIVRIAHDLGKQTVAEFVATPGVLAVARAEGVDYVQGQMIGMPVAQEEFIKRYLTGARVRTPALADRGVQ